MSHSYAKSIEGCVINQDKAYALAEKNAHRVDGERRSGRIARVLFGVALPLGVTGASAALGITLGDDLARTALGRAVLELSRPIVGALAGAGPIEILIGGAFLAIAALIWHVRS
ncbi:MAG: hypothetical protein WD673_15015 [Alphaproteobacteria bacterium]